MRRARAALLTLLLAAGVQGLAPGTAAADTAPIATVAPGQPAGSADGNALTTPPTPDSPPAGHKLTSNEVQRIADRQRNIVAMKKEIVGAYPGIFLKGRQRWQVSYYARTKPLKEVGQVIIDDATAKVTESYTGYKVAWSMARGYAGAFGRKVNSPWVWLPMTVLFLVPFLGPRRGWRPSWLMADVSVLAAFGISVAYFNDAQIDVSVPLAYPLLAYLLARMLWIGLGTRPARDGHRPLPTVVPVAWLAIGLVFLVGFRIGLNVTNSNVIDVGYSGVIGADKLIDGAELYGGWPKDNEHGDTYGPVTYAAYVPFRAALGWTGRWDDLPAAHGAAIAFDLLGILLLFLVGRMVRGPSLGVLLAYSWAAFPFSMYALMCNSNDSLVAVLLLAALLAAAHPARRGALAALGGLTKFATLAVTPLFATHALGGREDGGGTVGARARTLLVFSVAFAAAALVAFYPVIAHGQSPSLVYDRTLGFQTSRGSPFSIWGLYDLPGLQHAWQAFSVLLAVAVAVVPRRRDVAGLAACAGAVVIALQGGVTHWFYLYVVWFFPLVMVAVLARYGEEGDDRDPAPAPTGGLVGAPVITAA